MAKNMSWPEKVQKRPKAKVIIQAFGRSRFPKAEGRGYLLRAWEGLYMDSHCLERKNIDFYDYYRDVLVVH